MNASQQGWNNGLSPGDFARYKDGAIVRVLEIVPRFCTLYGSQTKVEIWSKVKCWKVLTDKLKNADQVKRRMQIYRAWSLEKINVQELLDNFQNAAKIVEEESKKVV